MAQRRRKLVRPAGQLADEDDDPPIVFNFDEDSDDSNPQTAQNKSPRQVQTRAAAQAAPAAAQPAAADQYLQNIQQMRAMIEALEAKKAREARSGAAAGVKPRRKSAKAAPAGNVVAKSSTPPPASAAQAPVPANSAAAVPSGAAPAPLTEEQLLEDLQYILGEQVSDDDQLRLLQQQVDFATDNTEAATNKAQAVAATSGLTAATGAAVAKPVAVRKSQRANSVEPPAPGNNSRGPSPAPPAAALLATTLNRGTTATTAAVSAAALAASGISKLSSTTLAAAISVPNTRATSAAAAGASAVRTVRPAAKQSPKAAAAAARSPQQKQSPGSGAQAALKAKSNLGFAAGASTAAAAVSQAAVRPVKPKTASQQGLQTPQEQIQQQQGLEQRQQQLQRHAPQQQHQHQQQSKQPAQQQEQHQEGDVDMQQLDVAMPQQQHLPTQQQQQQVQCPAAVAPEQQQQQHQQLPPTQSPLLSLLLSSSMPAGLNLLQPQQQQQAMQLLAQQQRCLIQERILQQEVQQLQQNWQQVNQQLAGLLGPNTQAAAATMQAAGSWLRLTNGQTVAPRSLLFHQSAQAGGGATTSRVLLPEPAAAEAAAADGQFHPAVDVEDLVRQRAAQLQRKRQQYEQQLQGLHDEVADEAADAGSGELQRQQQQHWLQPLALEAPPAPRAQEQAAATASAAVGGSRKRQAADEAVAEDGCHNGAAAAAKRRRLEVTASPVDAAAPASPGDAAAVRQQPGGSAVEAAAAAVTPAAVAAEPADATMADGDQPDQQQVSSPPSRTSESRDMQQLLVSKSHSSTTSSSNAGSSSRSRSKDGRRRSPSREHNSRHNKFDSHRDSYGRRRSPSRDRGRAAAGDRDRSRDRDRNRGWRRSRSRERRGYQRPSDRDDRRYSCRRAAAGARSRSRSPVRSNTRQSERGRADRDRSRRHGSRSRSRSASRGGRGRGHEQVAPAAAAAAPKSAADKQQPAQQPVERPPSRDSGRQQQQLQRPLAEQQVKGQQGGRQEQQQVLPSQQGPQLQLPHAEKGIATEQQQVAQQQQPQDVQQQKQQQEAPNKYVIPSRRQKPPAAQPTAVSSATGDGAAAESAAAVPAPAPNQSVAAPAPVLQSGFEHFTGLEARRQRQQQRQQQQQPGEQQPSAGIQDVDMELDDGSTPSAAVMGASTGVAPQPAAASQPVPAGAAAAALGEQQVQPSQAQAAQGQQQEQQQLQQPRQWPVIKQLGWSESRVGCNKGVTASTWPLLSSHVLLYLARQQQSQQRQGGDADAIPAMQQSISNATACIMSALGLSADTSGSNSSAHRTYASGSRSLKASHGRYSSSLLCLRSYRLAAQFSSIVGGLDPGSSSFCNTIDPHWPLCRHEARGVHRDISCAWQHWSDMSLNVSGIEKQLQQLLAAAGVPDAAATASQWKTDQLLQQSQQQPAAGGQQLQQQRQGAKRLHDAVVAAGVDWLSMLQGGGSAVAAPAKQARAVDAAAKAATMDAAVPAAVPSQQCLGLSAASSTTAAGSQKQQGRVVVQQNAVLACADVSLGQQQATQQQQQQPVQLYPWCCQLSAFGQPLAGLDLYNLPSDKQQEAQLTAQQQHQVKVWMQQKSAGDGRHQEDKQQRQQQVKQRGWRYFDGALPKFGALNAAAATEMQTADVEGATAACVDISPATGQALEVGAAEAARQPSELLKSAFAQIDAEYEARRQQQQQPGPNFWISWALATLDVLSKSPGGHAASVQQQTSQQQPGKQESILNKVGSILLKGLAVHPTAPELWLLHGQLLLRRAGFGKMQMTILHRAEGFCGSSYDLWLLSGHVQATWQQQLVVWLKALAYMSAAAEAAGGSAGPAAASPTGSSGQQQQRQMSESLADCLLDVALRLVRCLCDASADELFCIWCNMLLHTAQQIQQQMPKAPAALSAAKVAAAEVNATLQNLAVELANTTPQPPTAAAGGKSPTAAAAAAAQDPAVVAATAVAHDILAASNLSKLAVQGLLAVLRHHPVQLATFWLSLCHTAACHALPTVVEARLQYRQQQQQCGFVLDAHEFATQSAATGGTGSQGLQMAGRLLLAAVEGQVPGLEPAPQPTAAGQPADTAGQQQQQPVEVMPGSALTQRCISSSYQALSPYWHLMGLPADGSIRQAKLLLQAQHQQQGQPQGPDNTAVSVLQCLTECQPAMGPRQESPSAAQDTSQHTSSSSIVENLLEALALPQLLLHQEIWIGRAAAAAGEAVSEQQQRARTNQAGQLLFGYGASGLACSMLQDRQADIQAAIRSASHAGVVAAAADRDTQPADPSAVRAAYQQLLDLPQADTSAVPQQQQQQQQSWTSPLAVATPEGQLPQPLVMVQRCLTYITWCGYEVNVCDWNRAAQCLTQGLQEAKKWQQPELVALMHTQLLALLAAAARTSRSSDWDADDAVKLVTCLRAVLRAARPSSSSSNNALPLHYPPLRYTTAELSQRLEADPLQCCHPVLEAGLETVLSGLNRQQVVLVVEHLLDLCPPHPRLLQLLLHTVQHHNTDQGWAAWLAPLLIRTCCNSKLSAPAWMWAALVDVVRGVSAGAAAEVAKQGLVTHPWSRRMWQLHFETAGASEAKAAIRTLAVKHGFQLDAV